MPPRIDRDAPPHPHEAGAKGREPTGQVQMHVLRAPSRPGERRLAVWRQ
jgi:hypothetical protein